MARTGYQDIPEGAPAPDGAVDMITAWFDADGAAVERATEAASVSISYYDAGGDLMSTTHAEISSPE